MGTQTGKTDDFIKSSLGKSPKPYTKRGEVIIERQRKIQLKIWVSEEENNLIKQKMQALGTENFGAFARKMLIDGYVIKLDYSEQKKLAAAVNKIGVNINTICRKINSTGNVYQDDVDELKEKMEQIWQLLKLKQSEEL